MTVRAVSCTLLASHCAVLAVQNAIHRCYKHIEDVHVTFSRQENHFWQNYGILDLDNFQVRLQYWVASLYNQLLPQYSSNQFETLHRCYKRIEDVHVTFSRQENHF